MKIQLGPKIRSHLAEAKRLAKSDDEASLRYACLELRFVIEFLTYDRMQGYTDQMPYDVFKKWQPGKVMKALSAIDSTVEQNSTIRIFEEDKNGHPCKLVFEGNHESFTIKWATKAHNSLGYFLHAPTLDKVDKMENKAEVIRKKIFEIIEEVDRVLSGSIHNFIGQNTTQTECMAKCGATIKRSIESIPQNGEVECPNPDCRAVHIIEKLPNDKFFWTLRTAIWTCECGTEEKMEWHQNKPKLPKEWCCPNCATTLVLLDGPHIVKKASE